MGIQTLKSFSVVTGNGIKQLSSILNGQQKKLQFKFDESEFKKFDNYFFKPINTGELEKSNKIVKQAKIQGMIAYSIFGKDLTDEQFLDFAKRSFMFSSREHVYFRYLKNLLAINIYLSDQNVFKQIEEFVEKWCQRNNSLNMFFRDLQEMNIVYKYLQEELPKECQIEFFKQNNLTSYLNIVNTLVVTKNNETTQIFLSNTFKQHSVTMQFLSLCTNRRLYDNVLLYNQDVHKLKELKSFFINQQFKQYQIDGKYIKNR